MRITTRGRETRPATPARARALALCLLVAASTAVGAQGPQAAPQPQAASPADALTRRLTVDDAVRLALENNLGLRAVRLAPQVQDLAVAQARAAWTPAFTTSVVQASADTPSTSFLSGGQSFTTDNRLATNVSVQQLLPFGSSYSIGWDSSRATTTNLFSNFSPQVRSSLALHFQQPILRNRLIDSARQQVLLSEKNRDIADVEVQQNVAIMSRTVRNAYWDLAFARASLQVQQQSLDLAQESLRNTRARVDIGTTPPIDIVEAEAEVATRQEAVIVAQASIETAEDALRALVFDPAMPDFWTVRIEPTDLPPFQPSPVNVDAVVRSALDRRTDLQQARKSLESNDISIRFLRNQAMPDVSAAFDYGLAGLGGTQFLRGTGFPGPIVGQNVRGFGSVLGDLFTNAYPNWQLSLNVSYPIGKSTQEANLARARLQYTQSQTQIRSQELQVVQQVRTAARQVSTNQQRVQTTRVSRELAERRLDAEQRKFAAGTSTSFVVFQVQRDLAQARNNELRAVLDFNRSLVDLDTVQQAPLTGTISSSTSSSANASATAGATAGTGNTGVTTGTTGTTAATGTTTQR